MDELKPCPFCGGEVEIVLCDDEGNLHDESYRERHYSGLGFMLRHTHEDNPGCPIASYACDGGILGGVYIYNTEEQAVETWNRRVDNTSTIDAVPVVRCWECKFGTYFGDMEDECIRCINLHGNPLMPFDGFCSYGERKEGAE